ncbi:uncharacterized protein LOC144471336 isoform X2 [Augochlora pura]
MDEYDKKFAEMQKYIPFLEAMIERLQNVKDKSREVQLQKMQSLHGILSNSKRKLKIETLQRCEDVLQKLHNKVEKGNTPGLHFPNKKNGNGSVHTSILSGEITGQPSKESSENKDKEKDIHETPASPSPPVSPDFGSQVAPIIIPTERSVDFIDDSKPASPDPVETLPTKTPIIIPTERTSSDHLGLSSNSPLTKVVEDVSFSEWDMLEENETQHTRNKSWPSSIASGQDVSATIKMVGSQLPQKVNDGRSGHVSSISSHTSRHIPTIPVPSLGGSRRLTSMLEKNRLHGLDIQVETRPESPVNVPDARLKSPDPDILFPKRKITSPRQKEARPVSKPPAPLLSPPPVSNKPPLSMEDLAELLNEETDNKTEKKVVREKSKDEEEVDSESERRWEEVDKHIVKLTSRKCLSNVPPTGNCKGVSVGSMHNTEKATDVRGPPSSPVSKPEPRYADNYERHPRQMRDNHSVVEKDKGNVYPHCRPDEDGHGLLLAHHSGLAKLDERGPMMYQRRQGNIGPEIAPPRIDADFRMEGPEYFNRQMPGQNHWVPPPPPPPPPLPPPPPPPMHPPVNPNDFCNNQWPSSSNFAGIPNSPAQSYQHPMGMHQEMWNVGSVREPIHVDPHQVNEGPMRSNQFAVNMNVRPMMSPNTSHVPRPEDMPSVDVANVQTIQPLISPTMFPIGPQYRNFQGENRQYEQPFDRPVEYSHPRQQWESQPVRPPSDSSYRSDEGPCVVKGPSDVSGSYSRPSTPCPWSRARGGGRGRAACYNERGRSDQRTNFNRDGRRPEWSRDSHNEWDNNRFSRDNRNISERDPRVRIEHGVMNQSPSQASDQSRDSCNSVRDPRLAKDKHFLSNKNKDVGFNERDPRKRSTAPPFMSLFKKGKDKTKSSPKTSDGHRRSDAEVNPKSQEKLLKDKMQSPLESLYGVIDTKAKSAQGSLQNFKIPKIKRNESLESPTSSHIPDEIKATDSFVERREGKAKCRKDKDDNTGEVSSSSDGTMLWEDWNGDGGIVAEKKEELQEEGSLHTEPAADKAATCEDEPDLAITTSVKASDKTSDKISDKISDTVEKLKKDQTEPEGSKPKEEVTQEWIEALIRKSFEFGEGKKFVEQAKFMQKLGEVFQAKKLKKIKKIIESESESSSSDKEEVSEAKKVRVRKKRRMIVSDSSDDELLADVGQDNVSILSTLDKNSSDDNQKISANKQDDSSDTPAPLDEKPSKLETAKEEVTQQDSPVQDLAEDKSTKIEQEVSSVEKLKSKPETKEMSKTEKPSEKLSEILKEIPNEVSSEVLSKVPNEVSNKVTNEVMNEESSEESLGKTPKAKAKRRNSLEMLQEDIREMFISDDVIAATGHRMCRAQKENQVAGAASVQVPSVVKKEVVSDSEGSSVASSKSKKTTKPLIGDDIAKDGPKDSPKDKTKGKFKKETQRVTRQRSKQPAQSSDSEEDQPLALRTERVQGCSSSTNQDDEPDTLRRSKRINNKDTVKEPRVVVEKTDISKLESTKVMFDSSSDESFGIDVSELTAAVDISLRPDKIIEGETPERKKFVHSSPRKTTRKKSVAVESVSENKDDVLSDGEESIISDVSMSSSVASSKKVSSSSVKPNTAGNKEELLSNILVGLCASKNNLDKNSSMVDKESDIDIDDDISDQLSVEANAKKLSAKKKKKKCNWQMGILSKKKKKKTPTCSAKESDLSVNSELDTSQMTESSSAGSASEMSSQVKDSSIEVHDTTSTELPKSSTDKHTEAEKLFNGLDINELIDYAWTGQERYKCLLCFFTGKNIVHHYKLNHSGKEILISRLKLADAQLAIQDAKDNNAGGTSLKLLTEEIVKFHCRFCSFFTEGTAKVAVEAFYEHCTTHTGEYRFRCNSCPYQAVAKSSMRTHYYKVCRKFKDTFNEAIAEDEVPNEDRVYGYLCSRCNYVQLKRTNLELHVQRWHKENFETSIVKINMSLGSMKIEPTDDMTNKSVKAEMSQPSLENQEESTSNTVSTVQKDESSNIDETEVKIVNKDPIPETEKVRDPEEMKIDDAENLSKEQPEFNETKKLSNLDADANLPTGKLSVFVCPPELEKKEVEIQLERKRKMQEIIQNIGIKLQKDASKKGLSIIDKLKDKMKTNVEATTNEKESDVTLDSSQVANNSAASTSSTESQNSVMNLLDLNVSTVEEPEANLSLFQDSLEQGPKQSESSISKTHSPNIECDSQSAPETDQTNLRMKDPLASLGLKKTDETDAEASDIDNARDRAAYCESDSSSEQSDAELSTDVNMILKETSNINASSKDPMLTTIQRLAAQLQATKPLEVGKEENSFKPIESTEKKFNFSSIPKPPGVVPIASIKRFIGKSERFSEITSKSNDGVNPPKNFIRLRRLSGDILSAMNQSLAIQRDESASKPDEVTSTSKVEGVLKTDEEEECSFLKIENVVSLAPNADNDNAGSPIINDIRKAVEISPVKSSRGVSLLKKSKPSSTPLILKKLNTVTVTQPMVKNIQSIRTVGSDTLKLIPVKSLSLNPVGVASPQLSRNYIPIAPKSAVLKVDSKLQFPLSVNKSTIVTPVTTRTMTVTSQSSNLNYKIVKVLQSPTLLKGIDPALKLKSSDAYNAMLKTTKLAHLYKCMGRFCHFTTDILEKFQQHYQQHAYEEEGQKPPFDYQKCAYCYMSLEDWPHMKKHIEEKHAHCRYQCSYCFYRAITMSYVRLHQSVSHPGLRGILLGKVVSELPARENVNRLACIHPYICEHDCGEMFYVPELFVAHLKSKHSSRNDKFKCHLCSVTCSQTEQLITHYKVHWIFKYQCQYCLSGADSPNDMHKHLSSFHCNRLPQFLERTISSSQSSRGKEDQLTLRILDDEVDNDGRNTKESVTTNVVSGSSIPDTSFSDSLEDINMLSKDENEALNKSLSSLFASCNTSTVDSSAQERTSSEKSCDAASPQNSFDIKTDPLDISLLDTPKLFNILPENCTDEFININLLDNPDFLKNTSQRFNNLTMRRPTVADDSKGEDSDIEIVDIVDSDTNSSKTDKNEFDLCKKEDTDTAKKAKAKETETKEQLPTDNEDSNKSTGNMNASSNITNKNDKPLTLEDIKDTGFTGTKLYKCGYEFCDYGAENAASLRSHVKECPQSGDNKNLNCAHCSKRFLKIGFLLEHLKVHGLKRFGCSLCKMRCTVGYQAVAHMKAKHRFPASKLVPADPKNPSVDGLFIVQAINQSGEKRGKKRKSTKSTEKENDKATDFEKLSFSPDEIESLPRQAIYNRVVQCAVCPFTTKVRTNIIRHLTLHLNDETVPESGPVNPVPCLDKKERMFDKMVNLASSSHQNGRMGGKPKEAGKIDDDEFIPKFVPEHKRYVCGVAECNYLTVDEAMLRCHLKALHSEEQYFRCPHCPQLQPGQEGLNIAIDKMGVHLKMHDTRLYKCSHCNHHHYHSDKLFSRHVVERHLSDKHPEKRPFVKVIRELENTENNQSLQEENEEEVPDPDGNHWKCNICEYKCVYKAEMATHASTVHDEKSQYKCTLCSFKTSGKIVFEQHISNKHSTDPNVDYELIYQRIKGVNKKSNENIEQSGQEEPFDTTPLWRRDMPRIRHIRGILLEEENETSMESSTKQGKRKSDTELQPTKPAKLKPGKLSVADDIKPGKEKSKRLLSCDKSPLEQETSTELPNAVDKIKDTKIKAVEDKADDSNESDTGRFGSYGKSDGNMYVCTLCTQFKTKYKHDMRDHLYRELNYARWHCKECGYLSVNRNALFKHFTKHHNGERSHHEPLSPDNDIEDWVITLLTRQTATIKAFLAKQNSSSSDTGNNSKATTVNTIVKPSSAKTAVKPASIANKSNTQGYKIQEPDLNVNAMHDGTKDTEGLIMDESPAKSDKSEMSIADVETGGIEENREKPLVCKHCKTTFTRWRGFKLHVQLTHLKRLGFLCPYCDRSTNSESLMRQHIRSKHPGCQEKIVQNPDAGGPELTDEFWQKEYGLVFPKRTKKRKRKVSETNIVDNDNQDQPETQEKCNICGFVAANLAGLKGHMRVHVTSKQTLKCSYCPFVAATKTELWNHAVIHQPFKSGDAGAFESSSESGTTNLDKKTLVDDCSDDIEEEQVSDSKESDQRVVRKLIISDKPSAQLIYPFRYEEIELDEDLEEWPAKPECSKTETKSSYGLYLQQSCKDAEIDGLESKQEGWICQWCNELCESEVKMKTHHDMFHSHLPLNFKKQQKAKGPRGYVCPECSFATTSISVMKNHVTRHINLFKCKYCEKIYSSPTQVSTHNSEEHPGMELKIESIQNYESLLEKMMDKIRWQKPTAENLDSDQEEILRKTKNHAVAKKSTARSTIRPNLIPYKVKAVARKSTNPHSKYLSPPKIGDRQQLPKSKQFSYYGIPRSPVNLAELNTYMVVGGHRMKVNCTTLSQLINIDPKVILRDLKHVTDTVTLKKLK